MSLATRCTACGTIFRIVEDQLRVSDGWVRCGRCAEVFDARELLFDIDRDAPPSWGSTGYGGRAEPELDLPPPPAPLPPPPPPRPAPPPPVAMPESEPFPAAPEPMFAEPAWPPAPQEPALREPELRSLDDTPPAPAAERLEPRWDASDEREDDAPVGAPLRVPEPVPATLLPPPPPLVPEFMKTAERGARWQRPGVRWALAGASGLLVLTLALQVLLHFRDAIAALHPPAAPALQTLCGLAGCQLQPWRHIEALSIDASSLTPISSSNHYRLNLSLRNKSAADAAAPWVELSLTDASGTPFTRRVFAPEALNPAVNRIKADSEQALNLSFGTGNQRVSGYSVNIFYP